MPKPCQASKHWKHRGRLTPTAGRRRRCRRRRRRSLARSQRRAASPASVRARPGNASWSTRRDLFRRRLAFEGVAVRCESEPRAAAYGTLCRKHAKPAAPDPGERSTTHFASRLTRRSSQNAVGFPSCQNTGSPWSAMITFVGGVEALPVCSERCASSGPRNWCPSAAPARPPGVLQARGDEPGWAEIPVQLREQHEEDVGPVAGGVRARRLAVAALIEMMVLAPLAQWCTDIIDDVWTIRPPLAPVALHPAKGSHLPANASAEMARSKGRVG